MMNISQDAMHKERDTEEKKSSAETSVRNGYKQTKLGWIPEDWGIVRLNETGKIITGSTPKTAEVENYNGDYLFVSPADINSRKYINETIKTLSHIGFSKGRKVKKDSILFVCIGSTIGKLAIAGKELITNQQINSIIPSENFDSDFLYYQLSRNSKRIKLMAGEQAVPLINKTDFSKVKIVAPPLPEQQKIAQILSTWDKAIALQEQLITEKQALKKGLMQELLTGKKRFPGFEEEWKEVKFKDITKINQGLQIPISKRFSNKVPNSFFYITNEFLKKDSNYKYYILNPSDSVKCSEDDILMTRTGNTGMVVTGVRGVFHNNFFKIAYNKLRVDKAFLFYTLNSDRIQHTIKNLAGTSTIPDLNHSEFYGITIILPKVEEQEKIAGVLSNFDIEIENLIKYKDSLIQQKQGLMQVLLTGRIRVNTGTNE